MPVSRWLRAAPVFVVLAVSAVAVAAFVRATPASPATARATRGVDAGTPSLALKWVYALYVDADDSLDYAWPKYSEPYLDRLAANPQVKVVALIDRRRTRSATLVEYAGGHERVVANWREKDFGRAATLRMFITQVHARYPAEHLAVNVWDHGFAWRGFSYDQTSDDQITLAGMTSAIKAAGVPIDILAFDACNMADAAAVYQAGRTGLVNYVVASEEEIDEAGFPYDLMLRPLIADPGVSPAALAKAMVSSFATFYSKRAFGVRTSLTAVDAAAFARARDDLASWSAAMTAGLPADRAGVAAARSRASHAAKADEVDLGDYLTRLVARHGIGVRVRAASERLLGDLRTAMLVVRSGAKVSTFTGLTIWWPTVAGWGAEEAAYSAQTAFAGEAGWAGFLRVFER